MTAPYQTWKDKYHRTNTSVLVKNYDVTSRIIEEILPEHDGFITANVDVEYIYKEVPVMTRKCQIMMRPDKSEASITTREEFFACDVNGGRLEFETITITREQFDVLAKLFSGEK